MATAETDTETKPKTTTTRSRTSRAKSNGSTAKSGTGASAKSGTGTTAKSANGSTAKKRASSSNGNGGSSRSNRNRGSNGDKGGLPNFTVMAGAAGAGAVLGVLAMLGRKVAVQAPTAMAGNWADALAAEHQAVLKVFDALERTTGSDRGKRNMLLAHMKHALAKHALQEENVIYPALREAGEIEAADELNKEHGYVKQYLYELENLPHNSPEFLPTLARFRKDIEEHMHEEEDTLFPKLRAQLSDEKNKHLTVTMNKEGFKLA